MGLATIFLAAMAGMAGQDKPPVRVTIPAPPPVVAPPPRPTGPNLLPIPRTSTGRLISDYDYPAKALRENRQGSVRVQLDVNRWGRVADCRVVESSGHDDLDAAACDRLATRATFWPATDAAGKDTSGSFATTVRWALPEERPGPPLAAIVRPVAQGPASLPPFFTRPGKAHLALTLAPDGRVTGCKVSAEGGVLPAAAILEKMCADTRERGLRAVPIKGEKLPAAIDAVFELRTTPAN